MHLHPRSIKSYSKLNGDEDEKYEVANVLLRYGGGELLLSIPIHYPSLGSSRHIPSWKKLGSGSTRWLKSDIEKFDQEVLRLNEESPME